ncbi:lipopolysaccharide/colanic/teichoic acid biosynthesis glycosyltransferase [Dyadobacter jejuensis]|uniref:Lipopolysaccharide/colanic/teichoic acid biosynthesis glycosyltransferase n=1 Tax=Dyadobacter jejuensis TaxID=1082580 RepID=A0A316AH22_9BACT|nr:sugar transferase [Dyadobacter jejuensis]PWJ56952.1 lipopolysaccharide/colanic/teichoic acid biosynthesis glycosyltransferase [Dyadobacter jejuensis]
MYARHGKRIIDLSLSLLVLIVLSPLLLLLATLIAVHFGGNPFFLQWRPGKDAILFRIYKFKTLKPLVEGAPLPDQVRITKLGGFLRKTGLDELPQLVNVIRGEMSLVGPRPLLPSYIPLYTAAQNERHQVRPGITGWAQIQGRNTIGWERKMSLDIWYVHHLSFQLDMSILCQTFFQQCGGNSL